MVGFNPITLGSLIGKDLKKAHILPVYPLPANGLYSNVPFINDKKYKMYDYPPPDPTFNSYGFAWNVLATAGSEFNVLVDRKPIPELQDHWKQWLPVFPTATTQAISEGLADDTAVVSVAAIQDIPAEKYSVDPDLLYKLNHKSTIPKIGVPCPRHMAPEDVTFPCLVKADYGWNGTGHKVATNKAELTDALNFIKAQAGWDGGVVVQEYLGRNITIYDINFYLFQSGEIFWCGTIVNEFDFDDGKFLFINNTSDYEKEAERKTQFYDTFALPIARYLHEMGYFGTVCCEIIESIKGMFLVDMNIRASSGDTSHLLVMPYMAHLGFTKGHLYFGEKLRGTDVDVIHRVNCINSETDQGRVIILMPYNLTENDDGQAKCKVAFSVFGRSFGDVQEIMKKLEITS